MTSLRILTGKKHPKIKLQRLGKKRIWTFGSLVHQINFFEEVLKLEKIFKKNKVVAGKTPFFAMGPFCSRHSICLNIGFWQSSFEWKWCASNLSRFNLKRVLQFFENGFLFPENLFQGYSIENVWNLLSHKNMPISQTEDYFKNPYYRFLEKPTLFLLVWKWKLLLALKRKRVFEC